MITINILVFSDIDSAGWFDNQYFNQYFFHANCNLRSLCSHSWKCYLTPLAMCTHKPCARCEHGSSRVFFPIRLYWLQRPLYMLFAIWVQFYVRLKTYVESVTWHSFTTSLSCVSYRFCTVIFVDSCDDAQSPLPLLSVYIFFVHLLCLVLFYPILGTQLGFRWAVCWNTLCSRVFLPKSC